ncbi:MAG: DUF1571 domain-containing protein [Planctomycetia bacterium]|nr:DUF1571 domain-containing protein [Planctomycetia bacterium]
MLRARRVRRQVAAAVFVIGCFMLLAWLRGWGITYPDAPGPAPPPERVAGQDAATPEPSADVLRRGLKMADSSLKTLESMPDYSFTMVKQERVKGQLQEQETIEMKIRHSPFSVYARHVAPDRLKGQEAIYVADKNDNCMVAHLAVGIRTVTLPTDGWWAMQGNRHPITSAGMKNLLLKLKELAATQKEYLATCDLRFVEGEQVDGRACECLEIRSSRPGKTSRLALARIYLDRKWNVPVKYEAWEFPKGSDVGKPVLVEYYEYLKVRLRAGLTDADFDPANPNFQFPAWGRGT